jgi:outer membrane protein
VDLDEIDVLNKHLAITKKLESSGSATTYDILTVKVRIAEAKTSLIEARNQLTRNLLTLQYLMNIPDSITIVPIGNFTIPALPLNSDSLIDIALQQSPAMRLANSKIDAASLQVELARAEYWPTLFFGAAGGFKNGIIPDINKLKANYSVSTQLVMPLFEGLKQKTSYDQSRLNLQAVNSSVENTRQNIRKTVLDAVNSLQTAQAIITETEPQVRLADTAYGIAKIRYETGVTTSVDLLDAQIHRKSAQLKKLQAEFELNKIYYNLRFVVGDTLW